MLYRHLLVYSLQPSAVGEWFMVFRHIPTCAVVLAVHLPGVDIYHYQKGCSSILCPDYVLSDGQHRLVLPLLSLGRKGWR